VTTTTGTVATRAAGARASTATAGFAPIPGAPALRNRGHNYVAIYRSLDEYGSWLQAEHPDPALVERVWTPYTDLAQKYRSELTWLRTNRYRWASLDARSQVQVASVVKGFVSLRVEQHLPAVEVRDPHGAVLGRRPVGPDFHWIVMLSDDGTGTWTIASIHDRITGDTQVQL
jgi:hypothetical protein